MLVGPVEPREPDIQPLLAALTAELAGAGYTAGQSFGYSVDQLERGGVHLVAARLDDEVVGVAGIELQETGAAELKRFYVLPAWRGAGVADALIEELFGYAAAHDRTLVRLETGDKQLAALRFYRRHGFSEVDRFGPYVGSETSICLQRSLQSGQQDEGFDVIRPDDAEMATIDSRNLGNTEPFGGGDD